ncbi:helix-turn-helix domain-containing protein [Candidatus Aerophobetes bacterium]|nr:helix-turn-helix domain-containing protein [Candidatus Aerophobetes bacterium]
MTGKRLLDIKEAAEFLNVSPNTLYSWVSQRRIPFVKLGRRVEFDLEDLQDWIEHHKVKQKEF